MEFTVEIKGLTISGLEFKGRNKQTVKYKNTSRNVSLC